jgi:hypothetical protein
MFSKTSRSAPALQRNLGGDVTIEVPSVPIGPRIEIEPLAFTEASTRRDPIAVSVASSARLISVDSSVLTSSASMCSR